MSGKGLRVTGGELGGRRLRSIPRGVRPTSDRVRESLFARLGPLGGAAVLDLYAGTGVLGIEAVSRGASRVVFVEQAAPVVAALRESLAALGIGEQARVVRGDVARCVRRLGQQGERFDLVLIDPPYASEEVPRALAALLEAEALAPHATVVVEHGRRHPVAVGRGWVTLDEWAYGETQVTRLEPVTSVQAGAAQDTADAEGGSGT